MTVIGETLRRERLRRNLELDEISRELKISSKFLEAIEDERFDKLPRGVFAKSFVRQYARLLGLDEEELAGGVQRAVEPSSGGPQFAEQAPQPPLSEIRVPRVEAWQNVADSRMSRSSSLPALAGVVVVMLICSGVYALWQRLLKPVPPRGDAAVPTQAAQVQQPSLPHAGPAAQPAASPETAPPQSSPVQPPPQNAADRPAGDGAAGGTPGTRTGAPGAAATSPAGAAVPGTATQVQIPASNPNAPVRVDVTADDMVWVSAKTDGKNTFSGTLTANQTRTFDANETVTLRLGNAGGVTIKLNGQPIGSVGPKGQIRTVQFTSGGFQIVVPPKPALDLDDFR